MPRKGPRLTKAEKKLAAENSQKQRYRDHLKRELKYTKLSYERGEQNWEKLCEEIKLPLAQTELKCAMQNVSAVLDEKQNVLDRLMDYRKIAEEQYRESFGRHCDLIDYVLKLFQLFVEILRKEYENAAYLKIIKLREDKRTRVQSQQDQKNYYENVLFATNFTVSKALNLKKTTFKERVLEMNSNTFVECNNFEHLVAEKMTAIYTQMMDICNEVNERQTTPLWRGRYIKVFAKFKKTSEEICKAYDRIRSFNTMISSMQRECTDIELNHIHTKMELKRELEFQKQLFHNLKKQVEKDIHMDDQNLRTLAEITNATVKNLLGVRKRSEHILNLLSYVRKLERQCDKINSLQEIHDIGTTNYYVPQLEKFVSKLSTVQIDNQHLEAEKLNLIDENNRLRDALRQYCHEKATKQMINSLGIDNRPTIMIPFQEASTMRNILRN